MSVPATKDGCRMASWDWGGSGKGQLMEGTSRSVSAEFGLGGKLSVGVARSPKVSGGLIVRREQVDSGHWAGFSRP